jgi:hypothetical protein
MRERHVTATHLACRELAVSFAAGDRLALEYLIDDAALRQLLNVATRWSVDPTLALRFSQRPATPKDSCAISDPPRAVVAKPASDPQM